MNFLQLAKERYSVRSFSEKKVEQDKIDDILEAGRIAPTAVNKQPQRILVINEPEQLAKLKECTPYHFNAPLAFLVCYDKSLSWQRDYDEREMGYIDASIVACHIMLQITAVGLGSTWVGHFDPVKIKELYQIPDNYIPIALFPTGYLSDKSKPSHLHEERLELSETVSYNHFK